MRAHRGSCEGQLEALDFFGYEPDGYRRAT
jgi:hypothetical protein